MFRQSIQPPILSLLSSVGSASLQGIWATSTDPKLPEDSFIALLQDDSSRPLEELDNVHKLMDLPKGCNGGKGKQLNCPAIHIQSPTLPSTYLLAPPIGELSLEHSWLHLQVRNLRKEFAFEVGIVDAAKRRGRIRWSTFQQYPRVSYHHEVTQQTHVSQVGPLLHIPISFPPPASSSLTTWCTIDVNIRPLLAQFQTMRGSNQDTPAVTRMTLPSAAFSSISYIKIYANCRVRRVWVSHGIPNRDADRDGWPVEFQLFGMAPSVQS